MSAFVDTNTRNPMIDWLTGRATPATAAARYLSIWNGDPQGAGTEVTATITGTATRISITTTSMSAASSGASSSNAVITITSSAVGAETVNYIALHTTSTGTGAVMASAAVTSKSITVGDALTIPNGSLTVSIT